MEKAVEVAVSKKETTTVTKKSSATGSEKEHVGTKKKNTSIKGGRKADGTFAKGNKPKITKNYGRPPEDMSFRHQVKLRASKDPKMVEDAINTLIKIARDPDNPKCIEAIDKLIKLNGNYDPQESKDVTPKVRPNPFDNLTEEELRKLAGEK